MKIALYLINGPLGAGKTTFLRELLKKPAFKEARVIENEFASTSIDTQQLHDHHAEIQTIAGVCICCSTGDELTDALKTLARSNEPVIIEATGVANSLKLIEKIALADMLATYEIRQAYFILDAKAAISLLDETLVTYAQELQAADLVLLSKTDLLSLEENVRLKKALHSIGIEDIHIAKEGRVSALPNQQDSRIVPFFAALTDTIRAHDVGINYTVVDTSQLSVDLQSLEQSWPSLAKDFSLQRMKGSVIDANGNYWHIEATTGQIRVSQQGASILSIVCIGARANEISLGTLEQRW